MKNRPLLLKSHQAYDILLQQLTGVEKLDLKKEHGVLPKKTFEISVNVWDEESLLTLLSDLTQILGRTQRTTANTEGEVTCLG